MRPLTTNDSHAKVWAPRTDAIPKVGTKVVIRLKPKPEKEDRAKDAENPPPLPVPAGDAQE